MNKTQSFKGIIIFLALVVILLFGAIYFLFQSIKGENENASNIQNSIDISTKQNQYTLSLQESIQNASGDIKKVNDSILSFDKDVNFIEQLENLARENGLSVSIDSLSVGDTPNVSSDNLTSLEIQASAQGSWAGMMVFLSKLESMPFAMRVERFDLANSSNNSPNLSGVKNSTPQYWRTTVGMRVLQYK